MRFCIGEQASQYSAFIRSSQETASGAFHEHAQQMIKKSGGPDAGGAAAEAEVDEAEDAEAAGGKRKKGSKSEKKKKKSKAERAEEKAQQLAERKADFEEASAKMKASKDGQANFRQWQPAALKGTLKDYQLEGLKWMATLYENGLSGILGDEMGLGKTIQIISLMAYLQEKNVKGPFIIAAPLATLPNWMREFKKWLPSMETLLYHGAKADRDEMRRVHFKPAQKSGTWPVIITSYEICIIDRRYLEKQQWQYLIVDEGQRVKNRNCRLIKELKALSTQNRLLLSGTPIQNTLEELWSLLNFVNPAIFDNLEIFQVRHSSSRRAI